ncbi:DUF6457 domain-containing protein [Streptomyces polyrhachis]|uniref:DUF6457 domain-containing protein n=1 Tax=Streptomyces polyrhachis TaxID=1282885 RepID=A0ABW2GP96_9ACTN
MKTWIDAVKTELDLDLAVDVPGLLDVTKTVAHGVARPAAPLTSFLIGYAAAQAGGGPEAVTEASRRVEVLAARWSAEDAAGRTDSTPRQDTPPRQDSGDRLDRTATA